REEQLRFLINCADLHELYTEYNFSLSPDNLLSDINLKPQALMRDAKSDGEADFLQLYKALIGTIFLPRYRYYDYLFGGWDLYKKNKILSQLFEMETVTEIKNYLWQEYLRITQEIQETKRLVPKVNIWASRIAIPFLIALLLAALFFGGKFLLSDIPYHNSIVEANTAYIAGNHIEVQQSLEKYDISRFSYETKYLLSRAYVITEALTEAQKDNVLTSLSLKTDSVIFDYWIFLGRLDFGGAIDIAQRLGDDELLLFAYLKYEIVVRNDTTMTGDEKIKLLSDLDNKINSLKKVRDDAESTSPQGSSN
ncbi:MAG: hypothetical protein LBB91_02720, partial [Clostridiales bacterium]|nr:hypothetical protein [Clostridiales bacterium]